MKRVWLESKKLLVVASVALTGVFAFTGCEESDADEDEMYTVSGAASGNQMVPAVAGNGSGNISGTYNRNTNRLDYNIGWSGLTGNATTVGFYTGDLGVNGALTQDLIITTDGSTGGSVGFMQLTDEQEEDLLEGDWYYTVTTATNVDGEIRGQIITDRQ